MTRTAVVWIDGERFVFRDDEVDVMFTIGEKAESINEAWEELKHYGKTIDE